MSARSGEDRSLGNLPTLVLSNRDLSLRMIKPNLEYRSPILEADSSTSAFQLATESSSSSRLTSFQFVSRLRDCKDSIISQHFRINSTWRKRDIMEDSICFTCNIIESPSSSSSSDSEEESLLGTPSIAAEANLRYPFPW